MSTVIIEQTNRIATLTLNREDKRNALCEQMVEEFSAAIAHFVAANMRCVVLRARSGSKKDRKCNASKTLDYATPAERFHQTVASTS